MCTATLVPLAQGGARLLHNRDEQRDRPPATNLRATAHAAYPIDPVSSGTWAAISRYGLAFALLNRNPQPAHELPRPPNAHSRGAVIPGMLDAPSLDDVVLRFDALDAERFMPFDLIALDAAHALTLTWMGPGFGGRRAPRFHTIQPDTPPTLWSSSGLGDDVVEADRQAAFARAFSPSPADWPDQQTILHRSFSPGREFAGFCMHRQDARTVSQTELLVTPDKLELTYRLWNDGAHAPAPGSDPASPSPATAQHASLTPVGAARGPHPRARLA